MNEARMSNDRWDPLNGAGAARRSLALPMHWRQNFTGRATFCGAGLKLALSPRLNFETIFGRFLPAMNLISSARDHRVILTGVVEIMRFNWITLQVV